MKGLFAKHGLRSMVALLLLVAGMFMSSTSMKAQTFLDPTAAQQTLVVALTDIGQQLTNMTPGTAAYNQTTQRAIYYKEIYRQIGDGNPVGESIEKAAGVFGHSVSGNGPSDVTNAGLVPMTTTKTYLLSMYQDAKQLLQI